jgi:haloalkane dehalogenase
MVDANEAFDGTFPFKPYYTTSAGFRMHFVDESQGPFLCLHGKPNRDYLYREVIARLAKGHQVIYLAADCVSYIRYVHQER